MLVQSYRSKLDRWDALSVGLFGVRSSESLRLLLKSSVNEKGFDGQADRGPSAADVA